MYVAYRNNLARVLQLTHDQAEVNTMTAYSIMINDDQRKILIEALEALQTTPKYINQPMPNKDSSAQEFEQSLSLFKDMLETIVKDEQEHPGVLHGLCL